MLRVTTYELLVIKMGNIATIVVRVPSGIVTPFAANHENQGLFRSDLISDRLIFNVQQEEYNAAKPSKIETKIGYSAPYSEVERELYNFEATDSSCRGEVAKQVLNQVVGNGNLSIYGLSNVNDCGIHLVAVEDYHSRESDRDFERGFSLRVGILQSEVLKGSTLFKDNVYEGQPYVLTPRSTFTSGTQLDVAEWAKFKIYKQHNQYVNYDAIWQPNTEYNPTQKIAAIAPRGSAQVKSHQKGIRLIFTQTHMINDNNELEIYVPNNY